MLWRFGALKNSGCEGVHQSLKDLGVKRFEASTVCFSSCVCRFRDQFLEGAGNETV